VVGAVGRNGCRRCSWEEELLLNSQFPDLSLEDKAVFLMGGGVMIGMELGLLMKKGRCWPIRMMLGIRYGVCIRGG
jgi:hypothetical protein